MASKPKLRTFVLYQSGHLHERHVKGAYLVGARNKKEAISFLRNELGKHAKIEFKRQDNKVYMPHGAICKYRSAVYPPSI